MRVFSYLHERPKWIWILFICIQLFSSTGFTADLNTLLQQSKKNSPAIKEAEANYLSKLADADGIDEAFLPEVFSKITLSEDSSQPTNPFAGEKLKIQSYKLGVRKQFHTGTQLEVSAARDRLGTVYPLTVPTQFQTRFNPSYVDAASISLRQPILRGFLAREILYQKQALGAVAETEKNVSAIQTQIQQAQTEHFYWMLMSLYERKAVVAKMLATAKEFSWLMQKRTRIGRSDFVDEVAAQSQVVKFENDLLNLDIEIDALSQKLASHAGVERKEVVYQSGALQKEYGQNYQNQPAETLIEKALAKRKDLEAARLGQKPLEAQLKLAAEKLKPQLNLFASYSTTGLGTKGSEASGNVVDFDHPKWAVGLEFNYKIGKKAAHAERASARAKLAASSHQVSAISGDIRRDILVAKKRLELSQKSLKQAKIQRKTLARKRRAEQRRVNQARSEKIAVLGFKLEELAAKNNMIQAWLNQKSSVADLKLALHDFD